MTLAMMLLVVYSKIRSRTVVEMVFVSQTRPSCLKMLKVERLLQQKLGVALKAGVTRRCVCVCVCVCGWVGAGSSAER